jgi:hypothetical protein
LSGNEPRTINHSDNFDHDTPQYVNRRLYELEQFFQEMPEAMSKAEEAYADAEEAHAMAEAWARLEADGRDVATRDAQVFEATGETRKALRVADSALKYAKRKVQAANSEREVLVTRSVNMRNQMKG